MKPLMLEERKTALERRDVRQKKWKWRMFLRQILVCCLCPNPKPLNNLHCHDSSSQLRLFITSFNHKLPSSTPNLLLMKISFIMYLSLSSLLLFVFLQCWKSLRKKHLQLHSLPADQADPEIVLSADCPNCEPGKIAH